MPDMVVTGSRLANSGLADADPVTVVNRQTLLDSPFTSLGSFLQSLPFMAGAPLGTTVNARDSGGGQSRGIETAELRGLGAERSLVLVNGRRFLPGGNGVGGLVDLAMIPIAMIERIEILKTGASVEYGADAVAGVINVITRQSSVGLDLRAETSLTDRGDGEMLQLSGLYARDYGDGHWLAGLTFADQGALGKGDRDFSRALLDVEGPANQIVPGGSSAPPNGNYRTSQGRVTLRQGEDGREVEDFRPFVGSGPDNDRYNFNPFEDLRQDSRRVSWFSAWRHQLQPALQLIAEFNWQQRDSDTELAPLPFFSNRLAGVEVAAENHYNPFGERLSDVRRRLVEAGARGYEQDNQAWRMLWGLEGDFAGWSWDASVAWGKNRVTQIQRGDLQADRLALALGPSFVDAQQGPLCGSPGQVVADCVPLNLFGGAGSIDAAMLAFVAAPQLTDHAENTQAVINANLSGELLELDAGPLLAAFGYEYRKEKGEDRPDPLTQAGQTTGAARSITRGQFDSHELYAEFGLPLLRQTRWAQALDLDLGLRLVDFSNFDQTAVFDTSLRYQPVEDVVMRLALAQAFRAPTIGELFGGLSQSNPAVDDPCADFSQLTQTQIDRCVAQGVPADGSFDQTGNETPQLEGGNQQLQPEDSRIVTAGVSWHPQSLRGLVVNLDYYRVEIDDSIAALGANTILQQCLETGSAQFCDRITRDGSGAITQVQSQLQNIASETAAGLDLELRYSHDVNRGRLRHALYLSHVLERELIAFPGAQAFVGAGSYDPDKFGAIPRWKGSYRLHWLLNEWDFGYALQWIGALEERGGELFPGTVNQVSDRIYHDLSLSWDWHAQARLSLGLSNVTDRDPPFLANADVANTDVSTYRLLGRSFRLGMEYRF